MEEVGSRLEKHLKVIESNELICFGEGGGRWRNQPSGRGVVGGGGSKFGLKNMIKTNHK